MTLDQALPQPTRHEATKVVAGFSWPEIPRWHDGTLYFSDMYNHCIRRLTESGSEVYLDASARETIGGVEAILGGMGWLPDGRLIVCSMHEKVLLVFNGAELEIYADLRDLATGPINDMVVDADGRAYVTQLGYDIFAHAQPERARLIVVEPDGSVRGLDELGLFAGPNGITISEDGTTLVVAEADANLLTALTRSTEDGSLSDRRIFAKTPHLPDGICLDSGLGVWAGMPGLGAGRFVEGGEITDLVAVPLELGLTTAVALGGADRATLYVACGLEVFDWEKSRQGGLGSIWVSPVPVSAGNARP